MNTAPLPRPEVQALVPDAHGGPDHAELAQQGLRPDEVLDFSASTNAFGPPAGVAEALAGCDVRHYPDRNAAPLRAAIARREGLPETQVWCANGAAQLIWSLALAYLRPGDTSLVIGPTFGEYRVASQLMAAQVVEWRAEARDAFMVDVDCVAAAVAQSRPRMVWLCNPNNPTGIYLGPGAVAELMAAAPQALWVIDEAYRPFVADSWPTLPLVARSNVVLLRSLTKDYALPGVRLGYALAAEPIVEALRRVQPPWSVSETAMAAGLAALACPEHLAVTLPALRAEAAQLAALLRAQGWPVLPSATHFFLVYAGDGAGLRARLLAEHRIQVRDGASFGLPEFVRIAARTPAENARLSRAMEVLRR